METLEALAENATVVHELLQFHEANAWINSLILPQAVLEAIPNHFLASWLRNFVAANLMYYGLGSLWCIVIYGLLRNRFFPNGNIPSNEVRSGVFCAVTTCMRCVAHPYLHDGVHTADETEKHLVLIAFLFMSAINFSHTAVVCP